jgi:hypothetical protein
LQQNRSKFADINFFAQAKQNISDLHLARSVLQFDALAKLMIQYWKDNNEIILAEWFIKEYLTSPYNRWSVTASGVPGGNNNQNAIESSHRNDKRHMFGQQGTNITNDQLHHKLILHKCLGKVSIGYFAHESIPIQLRDATIDLGRDAITLKPGGRVNRCVFQRAKEIIYTEEGHSNFFRVNSKMKLSKDKLIDMDGFLFNSSTHFWQADKQYSVSASASKSYLKSVIEGHFPHSMMWIEAIGLSLNMHFVRKINDYYECDCAAFWHSTECSHVEAAKHLDGCININDELRKIPHAKKVGRPCHTSKEMTHDATALEFAVENMTESKACYAYGTLIARRLNCNKQDRIYIGKVTGRVALFYFENKI